MSDKNVTTGLKIDAMQRTFQATPCTLQLEKQLPGGPPNLNSEELQAYIRNYAAHTAGISHEEMVQSYTDWADNYDKDVGPGRYDGPSIAATVMANYYLDETVRENIRILDVAAGTGRVGQELKKFGFKLIDALEPSSGMLKILVGRGVYKLTFEHPIGYERIPGIQTDAYDSLVIAGGMGEGHIPVTGIDEMIRIVKPGGTVFIVMREEYLSYVKDYVNKLEPYMDELAAKGLWKQLGRDVVENYSFNKNGVVFTYQILDV